MKKILSAVLVCALLVCSVFALASCGGGLSGTYSMSQSFTEEIMGFELEITASTEVIFSGNTITQRGSVTTNLDELDLGILKDTVEDMVDDMLDGGSMEITGTYEITEDEDGDKTITITYTDEDGETVTNDAEFEQGSDAKGEYVSIDGMKFYKN